jgi:hypothetical protein
MQEFDVKRRFSDAEEERGCEEMEHIQREGG